MQLNNKRSINYHHNSKWINWYNCKYNIPLIPVLIPVYYHNRVTYELDTITEIHNSFGKVEIRQKRTFPNLGKGSLTSQIHWIECSGYYSVVPSLFFHRFVHLTWAIRLSSHPSDVTHSIMISLIALFSQPFFGSVSILPCLSLYSRVLVDSILNDGLIFVGRPRRMPKKGLILVLISL